MTSYVDVDDDVRFDFDPKKVMDDLLAAVMDAEGCPYEAFVNLTVTHDEEVHGLNLEYRNVDDTTDVLSFPALEIREGDFDQIDDSDVSLFDPETGELILGDIVINADRVRSQAGEYGHGELREFAFLVAHSLYHLCGYDHMTEDEARVMETKQETTLSNLGITRE